MNITIQGTIVQTDTNILGYELNNGADVINLTILDSNGELDTTTPLNEQYQYILILYMLQTDSYQTLNFNGTYPNFTATLTSDLLSSDGRYIGQFKMVLNDQIAHTEKFNVWVKDSLNPVLNNEDN